MINKDIMDSEIQKLPPMPQAVLDVMAELNKEDVNFPALETKIATDPALAMRILAVANSPFYGFAGKIHSIKEACVILGIHTTRNIVMATAFIKQFKGGAGHNLDINALWQHSFATGAAAKILSQGTGVNAEVAFTAGLLNEIGRMALDVYFAGDYAEVIKYRDDHDCTLAQSEQAVLGFDHSYLGGRVARYWKAPDSIAIAIEQSGNAGSDEHSALGDLVHVADIVSRGLGIGHSGDTMLSPLAPQALQRLGLSMPVIIDSFAEIEQACQAASALIAG